MQSKRLILRRFTADDWQDMYEYLGDPNVVKYEPYEPFTEEACKTDAVNLSTNDAFWAICLKETGKVIGKIYLLKKDEYTWELGYTLNAKFQGFGYAFEASKIALNYVFNIENAHRVVAYCDTRNTKSWNLLERLGFRKEGHMIQNSFYKKDINGKPIWCDNFAYAMLREDWDKS